MIANELVTDAEVEKALDFLRDSARAIGNAKACTVRSERMTKHVKALEMKRYNELSVSAQEREAYASDAYLHALEDEARSAGEYEKLKSLREAAALKIQAWQTSSANFRSMKV